MTTTATTAPGGWWHPKPGLTWQWQLSGTVDLSVAADVFDIDYQNPQAADLVGKLHAQGKHAVCYLETGGWENYRPDAGAYPASVLGASMSGWPSERYVDVRQRSVLEPILKARFKQCADAHFDAVETDIDDTHVEKTGFPLTEQDLKAFNTWVAEDIHALGMAWLLKNGITGDSFLTDMLPVADGTVNEQCWQYNECAAVKPFIAAGKPVFNAEYNLDPSAFCPAANTAGFSSIRKNVDLGAWLVECR
ncbi:endo alpha-1,4 polygalactosaminidase [Lentzea nigeriaca]|uniref:endo alpha-1,4 polygalactosaminidase n=1 Tax=Lentzea nigeriaca TaxID=1128665 RepID=UPI00195E7C2A|nr:endo alpha-1,4 polygalactosaminidase [Lentzea nigeriaca]MBM7858439.1 hypothetical protein [Lentzea nigeriaca]